MLKRINQFLDDFYTLKARLEAHFGMDRNGAIEVTLMRRILGSINSGIDFKEPTGTARREFIGRMEAVFQDTQSFLEAMVDEQKDLMAHEAIDVSFSRGTMNGIELVREKFELWHGEYEENRKKENGITIGGVIPSLNISPFPGNTAGETEKSS